MSENGEGEIKEPTLESVKRREKMLEIRQALNTPGASKELESLGVKKVGFIGSAMEGTANKFSDTDFYVIHEGDTDFSPNYKNLDWHTQGELRQKYEQRLFGIVRKYGPQITFDKNNRVDDVSFFVLGKTDPIYDPKINGPRWLEKGKEVEIWNNNSIPRQNNLLSRLFRLK